jgi:uncharacterized membrane protein
MLDQSLIPLTFIAILGSGLIAGVFYAFSTFIMKALARVAPSEGIAAMQSINVVVINPMFLGVFMGMVLVCITLIILSILRWNRPGSGFIIAGCVLYLVGTFLVTMFGNVPLNDALAKVSAGDPAAVANWSNYVRRWTLWNHVRTAAAISATGAFAWGLHSLNTASE